MNPDLSLVNRLQEMVYDGEPYEEVRSFLQKQNLSNDDFKELMNTADQYLMDYEILKSVRDQMKINQIHGWSLIVAGLALMLYTAITTWYMMAIPYGMIISGAFISFKARAYLKNPFLI